MRKPAKQKTNIKQNKGSIRIIAGQHRGRKLPVILAEGLRPTTDRVKETVFNWLMPYIRDSHCLDCFAGAGSLGFEAFSRGASHVTMIELNKVAAKQIKENQQLLTANNTEVINTDTLQFLQQAPQPYDLVFIDPPFRKELITQTLTLLNQGWLKPKALVYLEAEQETQLAIPENWQLLKEKVAGQVAYRLYQVSANS